MGSLRAAYKFTAVRLLAVMGWPISIRTLAILGVSMGASLVAITFASTLFILRLVRDSLSAGTGQGNYSSGNAAITVVVLAIGVCFYIAVGALVRETLSGRRFAVRFNPNRELFRANDVAMQHVFAAESGPRAVVLFGLCGGVCGAAWIVVHENSPVIRPWALALLVVPSAVVACWLALSSKLAASDPRAPGLALGCAAFTASCLLAAFLGAVLARGLLSLTRAAPVLDLQLDAAGAEGYWLALAVAAAVVVFCAVTIRNLGIVRRQSFPVTARVRRQIRESRWKATAPVPMLWRALILNLVRDKSFALFRGIGICLILAAATAIGLRLSGGGPELLRDIPGIQTIGVFIVFTVSIFGSELLSKANNPVGLLPQLRYGWESGFGVGSLVWGVIMAQSLLLVLLAGPPMGVVVWAATGVLPLATLLIPWGIATSNIIGNALSRVRVKQADGSMEMSLAAAFIAMMLAVPVLGQCLLGNVPAAIAAVVYTALLTGGAKICLQRRILSQR